MKLFILNASIKEAPQDEGEEDERAGISQEELDADGPPKEAEVGRMTEDAIDAMGDQTMVLLFLGIRRHSMVERLGSRDHRLRPDHLADHRQH